MNGRRPTTNKPIWGSGVSTKASVRNVPGERNSKNRQFVEAVSEANVRLTVERIRELSPLLRDSENAGKIQIAGCIYDLNTGRARFLPKRSMPFSGTSDLPVDK